jgi:hypothetical protein
VHDEVNLSAVGAASCRDMIVAGSHSHKGKIMLESRLAFRAIPEIHRKGVNQSKEG